MSRTDTFRPSPAFDALLERIKVIGKEVIAPTAGSVDREARFPTESFDALKAEKLLSCYVPSEYGGMGLSMVEVTRICELLGTYCGSTAMIFAMHQIQVACIVHHALTTPFFKNYARDLVSKQLLLASATTEMGVGGDVRSSICAAVFEGDLVSLEKQAPVISYGAHADAILVTCRKSADAAKSDQIHVLVRKGEYELSQISGWDTLGFRGTCSSGFSLKARFSPEQILPVPYADIHGKTMHPFSHSVWASLWLGIANEAVNVARSFVKAEARKNPSVVPPSALRLAEVDTILFSMRGGNRQLIGEYQQLLDDGDRDAFNNFGFATRVNNLKLTASQLVVEIAGKAMIIAGISGYRNDSKNSLARPLRDAYGAALMVNNDRILGQTTTMQIALRD